MSQAGRWARREALAGALLALSVPLWACTRSPELAPVSSVLVRSSDLAPALSEAGIDRAQTGDAARDALAAAGFSIDEHARRSYRATVEVVAFSVGTARDGGAPSAEVVVEVELEQTWAAGPGARQVGRATAALTGGARQRAWRDALQAAAREAAQGLAADVRAGQKGTEALVADLAAGDPRVRERAIRALASRGARGASRAVAERVRDPDPSVARAAVDALSAFKDPGSTLTLIEAAQAGDVGTTLRLLPILVEIGGPDVEGYLLTLQSGHGDRTVRQAAGEALAKLRGAPPPARGAKR